MSVNKTFAAITGMATIAGTLIALLAYCKPPAPPPSAPTTTATSAALKVRPIRLPYDVLWVNASGPSTFKLRSSAAVIEPSEAIGEKRLHVRFLISNSSIAPVQIWARTEQLSHTATIEGWTIDAGTTQCHARPYSLTVVPVGSAEEQLVRRNEMGAVSTYAPTIRSNGDLGFTASYICDEDVERSAALFATARITFAHGKARRTVYFQSSALPLYAER